MDYRHFCALDCHQKAIVSLKVFLIVTQTLVQLLIIPLLELNGLINMPGWRVVSIGTTAVLMEMLTIWLWIK